MIINIHLRKHLLLLPFLYLSPRTSADQHTMVYRHSSGPVSPSRFHPTTLLSSDSGSYSEVDEHTHSHIHLSPTKGGGVPLESWRSKITNLTTRVPSPTTSAKGQRAEKKGILRKRAESFDTHTILSSKKSGGP